MTPRPRNLTPDELGFTPRPRVAWLSPLLLLGTAVRVVLAKLLGAYLDKRELQHQFEQEAFDHSGEDELWLDYVADLGDGFDSTYTVAYLSGQPTLDVDDFVLPRAKVLVMGGDQVYPTASWQDYEDRCKGPYQASHPGVDGVEATDSLYALPGNHDWYDGLTAFLRMFGHRRAIGGRRTNQRRSYFALKLPGGWWMYAIDSNTEAYIDDPQLAYFEAAAKELAPGDKVILCLPRPSWVLSCDDPRQYDTVDYLVRTIITPAGAAVPLMLSGDLHHYSRYATEDEGRQLVTSGGGGAYLSATHGLPSTVELPNRASTARHASEPASFTQRTTYPSSAESRGWALGVFWRLPFRNPGFVGVLGALQFGLLLALLGPPTTAVGAGVVLYGISLIFARPSLGPWRLRNLVAGFLHGTAHLAFAVLSVVVWHRLGIDAWWLFADLPVAVAGGGILVTIYLYIAGLLGINKNELFAGQSIEHAKGFVRIRITGAGELTIYPLAVPRINRRWRAVPDAEPGTSWIVPAKRIPVTLIEPPVSI
ncbi:metallophosphoesterase [Phytomonospora sp. NPDC050363]|uniref:metallophosphoesterase family protein n=1 Tax=Phytomonospora sp. NPDC050363 TaxID=3155642 RepID=UPI0033ECD623